MIGIDRALPPAYQKETGFRSLWKNIMSLNFFWWISTDVKEKFKFYSQLTFVSDVLECLESTNMKESREMG